MPSSTVVHSRTATVLSPKPNSASTNGGAGADISKSLAKSGTAGYQPADQVKAQPVDKPEKISNRRSSKCVSPVSASDSDPGHRFIQRAAKARFEQPNVGERNAGFRARAIKSAQPKSRSIVVPLQRSKDSGASL